MRWVAIILLFFSIAGFSQSVKIDGPTGTPVDLTVTADVDSADLIFVGQAGVSKVANVHTIHEYGQHMGATYLSTPGTQTIGTGGTFERLYEGAMAYTAGIISGFTESNGRLTYIGDDVDNFIVLCSMTISAGEAAQVVQIRIAKNGTTIAATNMIYTFTATILDAAVGVNWILELNTNDYIEIWGTSDTNADEFTIQSLTMSIFRH
jgi:hypothetical protein